LAVVVDNLGVDDLLVVLGCTTAAVASGSIAVGRTLLLPGLRGLVDLLRDLVEGGLDGLRLRLDLVAVVGLERALEVGDRGVDLGLRSLVDLVAQLVELLLGLIGGVLAGVPGLGQLTLLAVLVGVALGVLDHLLDLGLAEP